ncbi:GNAT family N-acetyltransferase [Pedobacter sp. NJ-S-72]
MDIIIKEVNACETWDLRHRVMWPEKTIDYVKLEEDRYGTHFGLFKGDQLISVVSLFITDQQAQFRKFATDNNVQGQGYGTKLLEHLMNVARHYNVTEIWCNARSEKAPFYKRFGMIEVGEEFSKEGINYVKMQRTINP